MKNDLKTVIRNVSWNQDREDLINAIDDANSRDEAEDYLLQLIDSYFDRGNEVVEAFKRKVGINSSY